MKKRVYSKEFKEQAVRLSYQRENIKELADELGVHVQRLYKWRTAAKEGLISKEQPQVKEDSSEVKRLRKALREKELELEILKKYESKLKDLENKRKLLEKEITDKYRDDDWLLKKETDEKIKELLAGRKEILKESKTMTVKMRQEIDALGTKLMWVNIAAMPIFFLILAFVVFMLRRVKR